MNRRNVFVILYQMVVSYKNIAALQKENEMKLMLGPLVSDF